MPLPAVERPILILELLLQHPEGLTPQDFQTRLGISRSTLYTMLRDLKDLGYVEQDSERSPYRCGPRLTAWQRSTPLRPLDLMRAFYTEAAALQAAEQAAWQSNSAYVVDETLALLLPAAEGLLVLAQVQSTQQVRSVFTNGQVIAAQDSAASFLVSRTIPEAVRKLGHQTFSGAQTTELAVPICPDGHHPEAALLISAPAFRQDSRSLAAVLPALREAAARLSYRLGAQVYAPFQGSEGAAIQPASALNQDEMQIFLGGPWAARLACVREDGTPHVVPVWHEWDGETFTVIAWQGSRWGEYLRANPQISLTVDEPWPPLRRVSVQGHAEPLEPAEVQQQLPALLERLSRRYLGQALHPTLEQRDGSLFRIVPTKMRGWRGLPAGG